MRKLIPLLMMAAVPLASVVLILALSLGIGWLLTLFTPLALFEGGLLAIIAVVTALVFWIVVMRTKSPGYYPEAREGEWEDEEEWESDEIPSSRFWADGGEPSWENWFRYVLANSIYEDIQEHLVEYEAGKQSQELAIRLAEVALALLKKKSPRTRNWQVTAEDLRRELSDAGQRPYEHDLLVTTAAAVNFELGYLVGQLRKVIREGSWDEPAEIP
jgi:hypothetical protein